MVILGVIAMVAFASFATRFLRSIGCSQKGENDISIGVCCSAWLIGEIHNGISESVNIGLGALALLWLKERPKSSTDNKIHQNPWLWAGISVGGCFWVSLFGLISPLRHFFVDFTHQKSLVWRNRCYLYCFAKHLALRGQL